MKKESVTFYLMRHAETYLNKYQKMQGWANAPLTEKGIKDCQASGRGLAHISFDAVYTSDLQRTKDTAQLILNENKASKQLVLIEKPELREVFFGSFEGLPAIDIWEKVKAEALKQTGLLHLRHKELNVLHEMDPQGDAEDYVTFWKRIEKGMVDLLQVHKNTGENVLVVCHGLAISMLLSALVPDFSYKEPFSNASVSKLIYENGQFRLESVNDTSHFIYAN